MMPINNCAITIINNESDNEDNSDNQVVVVNVIDCDSDKHVWVIYSHFEGDLVHDPTIGISETRSDGTLPSNTRVGGGLSAGAIVGIVVGIVVVFFMLSILLVLVVLILLKRRRENEIQ
jgi:hypothetical protein